jgi:hypothetical protein
MFEWLGNAELRQRCAQLEKERDDAIVAFQKSATALEIKSFECDQLGMLIETYRRRIENLLAALALQGRELGIANEPSGKSKGLVK